MNTIAPLPFQPDAVIFDLDGLLLDSERAAINCYQQASLALSTGIEPEFWIQNVGLGQAASRARLVERLGEETTVALLKMSRQCSQDNVTKGLPLRPEVMPLIAFLEQHNIPRAVATSSETPQAQRKLEGAGLLHRFAFVCTASDVSHPKPSPEIYLLAAHRLGVAPTRCVVLEDSPTGVRAALSAQMTAIQVPDLIAPTEEVLSWGHRIVPSLKDALKLLEAVVVKAP